MFLRPTDSLVLKLFWLGLRNAVLQIGVYDRVFLLISGVVCLLWPLSDLKDILHIHAVFLCNTPWIWSTTLATFVMMGTVSSLYSLGLAFAHADAPYLQVQPLPQQARQRMAALASFICSLCTAPIAGIVLTTCSEIVHKPAPVLWGFGAALAYMLGAGFGLATQLRLRREMRAGTENAERRSLFKLPFPRWMRRVDRAYPTWTSSWSIGLIAGVLPLSLAQILGFLIVLLIAVLPSIASLANRQAAPAAAGAVLSGFAAFMLVVRCHPLRSPVLRTSPIGFMRAWLSLLRLPLLLSATFFILPAGAAIAAEPSKWAMPLSGCFGLFVLDSTYAIFAAFFLMSPLLAAASFAALVFYASYKWVTYHTVVYACFAALLTLMWYRIRRSFYDGT